MKFKRLLPVALSAALLGGFHSTADAQKLIKLPNYKKEWSVDYQPFRIVGNLYYVGTADLCCYLITTPKGHILINTGLDDSEALIKQHIQALGFKLSDIKILLTTQVHFDHVGAMAAIKKQTGAKMMVDAADARVLADGGNSDYIMGGKGPIFLPVKAERLLHDGDTVKLGGMNVVLLHHPGHTKGSCSFMMDVKDEKRSYRVLIANMPTILDDVDLKGMANYPGVGKDFAYTLKAMKGLQFDLWLASHASQCDLEKKHKPGDAYHPEAFSDRKGYDAAIADLEKDYQKRLQKAK